MKINFLENTLIRLRLHNLRKMFHVFRNRPQVVIYPNLKKEPVDSKGTGKIIITETSIKSSVRKVVTEILEREKENYWKV